MASANTTTSFLASAAVAALCARLASAAFPSATLPVVVWDGAADGYRFNSLSKTVDDNVYTLNLNSQNTAAADGSYLQIGNDFQKAGITLTAVNAYPTVTNAFGSAGQVSVIIKCSDMNLSDDVFRGIIGLLAYEGGYYDGDNNVKIGVMTRNNAKDGVGLLSAIFANGVIYHDFLHNASAYTTDEQLICLTYDSSAGIKVYRNGEPILTDTDAKYGTWMAPAGVVLGGVDLDGSSRAWAQTGMKIKAIAVFDTTLTDEQVAAYQFPSDEPFVGEVPVSDINAAFGNAAEINVRVDDGSVVIGDTTFNATKVNFICDGSFSLRPPAGNAAQFDFSRVTGSGAIVYEGELPAVGGDAFTSNSVPSFVANPAKWTGTVWLKNIIVTDFEVNPYGNASSVVRLTGISGWVRAPGNYAFTNSVPVELYNEGGTMALDLTNGNSANTDNPNRCTVFTRLLGNGRLYANSTADKVVIVVQDASDYAGEIGLNGGKIVAFGETMPKFSELAAGRIYVQGGASVTNRFFWWATGGIVVDGELCAPYLNEGATLGFGGGTTITTTSNGVFTLTSTGNGTEGETDTSYSRIQGTGTLKYGGSGWRALSTNDFPTTMTLLNEQSGNILLSRSTTYTVGSLAGSCNFEGNYGSGDRYLRVLQARDTEWSGKIKDDNDSWGHRFKGLKVAPGATSSGTLTLSGTQTYSCTLTVETNASVNLVGTWVGPVDAAGSLGGTGTVSGNVSFSDGATLDVGDVANTLDVAGDLVATGTISVRLPAGTSSSEGITLISATGAIDVSGAKFRVYIGDVPCGLRVRLVEGGLRASAPAMALRFR